MYLFPLPFSENNSSILKPSLKVSFKFFDMEQQMQYLMWLKSKQILKSHYQAPMNSFNNSWEEQAFAEDAAGPLGSFVWPPRSYSCTFCRREFRSAQALGGHMNVHRRDRARLKQSLSSQTDEVQLEKHTETPSKLPETQSLPQGGGVSSPFSSASRASSKITQENSSAQSYVSPPFSSFVAKEQQRWLGYPSSPLGSDSNSGRLLSISNQRTASRKCTRKEELITLDYEHTVGTNLSTGIQLGHSQNLKLGFDNEETINSKRRKSTAISSLAFFHKPCSSDRYVFQPEMLRIKTNSLEDIDLELRLGDPPAVK